ncbi:DUF551 domain-containing protein [Klebsiella pneumoniae]|uniref:DUF551 domain-containing protein n=1 Tax=Klebsiella pneumoniae TaxID=573 RepID=UPI003AF15744
MEKKIMAKSTITREQQRQILIDTAQHIISRERTSPYSENLRELARMALAAMDSEPVEPPLDYLHGHKDGLEWAAQLAEANHPETGDWLYDDPIELAKAIRKGPDMPPAQPVEDSEPVAWTWHYREQWHVTNDKCLAEFVATDGDVAVLPLYRHAQPVPEMKPVGYLFVSEQGAIAYSPANWGMPGFRLIGQIYGDIDVESQPALVVPGKWIQVSERLPENKPGSYEYLVFETLNNRVNHDYWNVPDKGDDAFTPFWNYYGGHVTHWMPLPAAPQEVKGD